MPGTLNPIPKHPPPACGGVFVFVGGRPSPLGKRERLRYHGVMNTVVDLHLHSHYSRATSPQLTIEGIAEFAAMKGVNVIATGDITHPEWLNEIAAKTIEDGSGFLTLRGGVSNVRLALFGEVASIYKKNNVTRRVHTLFGVSSLAACQRVNAKLEGLGYNIRYDGRPIIGMDVRELAKIYFDADPQALVIPAHIWTPWFSLFGSKSGFDHFEECFEEITSQIFAIETGLSSDPAMNWRVSSLNNVTILSNSDAHSPQKIGREANVFSWKERTYKNLYTSLRDQKNLEYTIEFFPEEGKYHFDGHRACNVVLDPRATAKHKGICPTCASPLTIGVMHRVEDLADQDASARPHRVPYKSIIPLPEIIADAFGVGDASKKVQQEYARLLSRVGNEFFVLLHAPLDVLRAEAHPLVAEGIGRVRSNHVHIAPGYDGVFGKITLFTAEERAQFAPQQKTLF